MAMVTVRRDGLSFGCMKGNDARGREVVLLVYESAADLGRVRHVPRAGDLLWCRPYHASVFVPVRKVSREHLALRALPLPGDVLHAYFPLLGEVIR